MTDLKGWIQQFPRQEAEQRISELETELAGWKQALTIHDSLTGEGNNGAAPATGEIPTKPQAITAVLAEADGAMSPGEILSEMVERGWLPADPKFRKRFYATLSRMNSEERVQRLANGSYILPRNRQGALKQPF